MLLFVFTHLLLVFLMSIFDVRRYDSAYLSCANCPSPNEIYCVHWWMRSLINVSFCNFILITFYVILCICCIFLWRNVIWYSHIDNLSSTMKIEYRRGNIYQEQPYFGNSYHQLESREKRAWSTIVFNNSFK